MTKPVHYPHPASEKIADQPNQALRLASKAGRIMLANGAEIYRVEGTIRRICYACGYHYAECFAMPTGILLSLGYDAPDSEMSTIVKRVHTNVTDLQKVSEVNEFTLDFCAGKYSIYEAFTCLQKIDKAPPFKLPLRLLAAVLVAICYSLINGGDWPSCVVALVGGCTAYTLSLGLEKLMVNRFISIIISSAACTAITLAGIYLGLGTTASTVIIGAITIFLPGVAITNGTRDLLHGDLVAGITRIAEGTLIAISIAFGVVTVLHGLEGLTRPQQLVSHPLYLHAVFAFVSTIGVGLIINIPRRHLLITAVIGTLSWIVFRLCLDIGQSRAIACFLAACLVVLIAELIARRTREISTAYIIPSLWLFVPGIGMYNTMLAVLNGDANLAFVIGTEALMMAGSIAVAIVFVLSLFRVLSTIRHRLRQKQSKSKSM